VKYHDQSFRVVHVVDGDTLHIDIQDGGHEATRVRLWGVDTPETGHGNTPEMYFGPEAKQFTKETLDGRTIHLVLAETKTRDKYDRLLAYVFLERGGVMFNELLLEEGYAYADRRFPHHYRDQFEVLESRARREKKGLWAGVTFERLPPWRQRMDRREGRDSP
jgi:micrococcal nuclease